MQRTDLIGRIGILALAVSLILPSVARAQNAADIINYKGPDRQKRLEEGAKKEGQVVLYSAMIVNQAQRPIAAAFMKKYPFIKMTFWRGDSEDIAAKLAAEVRANNVVADVVEGTGVGELIVQAKEAQPFYSPDLEGVAEKYRDPAGLWAPTRLSYYSIAYNTKLVPPNDVPKTYEDLLDPKWKGKLAWRIGSSSGTDLFLSNLRLAWGEEKARAYFEKLAKQKIINFGSGSARTLVDRVVAGEYPIALNIFAHHPLISAAKGAPVNSQLMNPVATTAATMIIPKSLRHPHAAMLLIDFILSKEGQQILAQANYFPVRSDVPPNPKVAKVVPEKNGYKENFVGPDKLNSYTVSSEKIYQDLFR